VFFTFDQVMQQRLLTKDINDLVSTINTALVENFAYFPENQIDGRVVVRLAPDIAPVVLRELRRQLTQAGWPTLLDEEENLVIYHPNWFPEQ
jgi:hypothetical protein